MFRDGVPSTETVRSSKTLVPNHITTRLHGPQEDHDLYLHRRENLISHRFLGRCFMLFPLKWILFVVGLLHGAKQPKCLQFANYDSLISQLRIAFLV